LVAQFAKKIDYLLEQIEAFNENGEFKENQVSSRIKRAAIHQIDQAITKQGGRFRLGCGLKATACRLDNPKVTNVATTIAQYFNSGFEEPILTPQKLRFYYVITIKNFGTTIYLVFISSGTPAYVLLQLREKMRPLSAIVRLFWVVYENRVYTTYSRTGRLLLKSIENGTNPKIVALIEKPDQVDT